MIRLEFAMVGSRAGFCGALVLIAIVSACLLWILPWPVDGLVAAATALAYSYDLDRRGCPPHL
jgi:hypothetical protein